MKPKARQVRMTLNRNRTDFNKLEPKTEPTLITANRNETCSSFIEPEPQCPKQVGIESWTDSNDIEPKPNKYEQYWAGTEPIQITLSRSRVEPIWMTLSQKPNDGISTVFQENYVYLINIL